ncbi:membrane protein [Streptomyces rameus]|uniref:Membrane protein n=1 Tax=Streptomyces rameus TaxID=68261 RepID=A0ABP6N9U3_9ACTN
MGIESDQVVYEYLSRVGDVAQQRQLPSATRMRLVSELRNEIDRCRARTTVDSPAAVRRTLDGLGTPDEVVAAAGGTGGGPPQPPPAAVPAQPSSGAGAPEPAERSRPRGLRRGVPRQRPAEPAQPVRPGAPAPPHLAPAHELGDGTATPDWWRVSTGGLLADTDPVPGFVGGVEIPELLRRPPAGAAAEKAEKAAEEGKAAAVEAAAGPAGTAPEPLPRRRFLPGRPTRWSNPLLLLAAAALVAGTVLGNWFALLLGWAIAYGSRRLTAAETRWAVAVLPGTAVAAGLVWLWGRNDGRWGEPVARGHMTDAVGETWPWVVRGAALASALYLVWRSQRKG